MCSYREIGHVDPGGAMSDSVCRLSVQSHGEYTGKTTDLVLPAGAAVDSLLPDIVALARPQSPAQGVSWCLDRTVGGPINGSLSLRQNDVHDGDVLQLVSATIPVLGARRAQTVTMAAGTPTPDRTGHLAVPTLGLWAVTVASGMLIWSAARGDQTIAAAIACGGALGALMVTLRSGPAAWSASAVVLAFTAGFTAVPGGPAAPNVLLGAAAAFAVALVLLRVGVHAVSIAAMAFSAPMIVATTVASSWPIPLTGTGVALSAVALVVLSAAPRCAVTVAGLAPPSAAVTEGDPGRVERAHLALTAMVMGAAAAVAIGAVVVAVAAVHRSGIATLAFSWAVAAALTLRAPSYRLPVRRWAVLVAGMVCTTAAFAVTATTFPAWTAWLGGSIVAVALGIRRMGSVSVAMAQRVSYLEYAALAAVPPSALWAADIFMLVRGR